jgi:hypothetical protein
MRYLWTALALQGLRASCAGVQRPRLSTRKRYRSAGMGLKQNIGGSLYRARRASCARAGSESALQKRLETGRGTWDAGQSFTGCVGNQNKDEKGQGGS